MGNRTARVRWSQSLAKSLVLGLVLMMGPAGGGAFSQIPHAPSPPRLVNDLAQVMSGGEADALEEKLRRYNDSTSTQIAIVTVESLNGYDVQQFAYELAEKWGIGRKGKNNGILVLAAIGDRKMTIQTGYGVEDRVPDAYAKRVIQNQLRPAFKEGQYYRGFDEATDELFRMLTGAYKGKPKQDSELEDGRFPIGIAIIALVIIFLIIKRIGRGGGGTTIGGNRNRGGGLWGPILWGAGTSSWSGSRGGSSWGGGGGSSFGGFGGGSFGGGGASGDW